MAREIVSLAWPHVHGKCTDKDKDWTEDKSKNRWREKGDTYTKFIPDKDGLHKPSEWWVLLYMFVRFPRFLKLILGIDWLIRTWKEWVNARQGARRETQEGP